MRRKPDSAKKVRDPVCGMRFRPEKAASVVEIHGRRIHFCTDACRRQFEEEPERYVGDTETEPDEPAHDMKDA